MKVYDCILEGHEATEENAMEFANGFVFSESETSDYAGRDHRYIDTLNGIDVYYNFGSDCYFFADSEEL